MNDVKTCGRLILDLVFCFKTRNIYAIILQRTPETANRVCEEIIDYQRITEFLEKIKMLLVIIWFPVKAKLVTGKVSFEDFCVVIIHKNLSLLLS